MHWPGASEAETFWLSHKFHLKKIFLRFYYENCALFSFLTFHFYERDALTQYSGWILLFLTKQYHKSIHFRHKAINKIGIFGHFLLSRKLMSLLMTLSQAWDNCPRNLIQSLKFLESLGSVLRWYSCLYSLLVCHFRPLNKQSIWCFRLVNVKDICIIYENALYMTFCVGKSIFIAEIFKFSNSVFEHAMTFDIRISVETKWF